MLNKLECINKGTKKLGEIIIRLVSIYAFTMQVIQCFSSRWSWGLAWEITLLIIYFTMVMYPSKIILLLKAIADAIKSVITKNRNMSNLQDDPIEEIQENNQDVGGTGTDETNL